MLVLKPLWPQPQAGVGLEHGAALSLGSIMM